jgi:adenylate cyclase
MSSKIVVKNTETNRSFEYELAGERTRIGRAADRNDLVLDDGQVSREHAVIRKMRNSFMLVDLDSANGTFMGGQRIKERILTNGDSVTIGKYTLEYRAQDGALSVSYHDQKISETVMLKMPGEISTDIPQIDTSSLSKWLSPADPKSRDVLAYIENLRKKADTLSRLYELNQMLGSDFSLEAIFKKVSEMVFRLTHADRFLVLLKDADTGALSTEAAEFRFPQKAGDEIAISKTVVERVMSERVSLLSFDTQRDERLAQAKSILLQNIHSVMCAPLVGKSGVLGAIYVDCQERAKILREDDLELLNAVAAETSIAVDNAITHKRLVREELARAKYRRFMPPHVVDEILANPNTLNLGGTNSCVTSLFSDIRNFTTMAETLPPQEAVQILNEYFSDMTPIIFEHSGLLDKYMGDGLMALFGVPYPCDDAAANAVSAAISMQRRMEIVNRDLKAIGLSEIAIGIGINTGMVTVGYIGSEERTDYTAIGDPVNLAARLEKQAQGWQIIISGPTRDALGERFPVRPCGNILVKGRKEPVQIYEVMWKTVRESPLTQAEKALDAP